MVVRNLWICGLCLLVVGVLGLVSPLAAPAADMAWVTDEVAGGVRGGQYCPRLIFNGVSYCGYYTKSYGPYDFYCPYGTCYQTVYEDPNGYYAGFWAYFCNECGISCGGFIYGFDCIGYTNG